MERHSSRRKVRPAEKAINGSRVACSGRSAACRSLHRLSRQDTYGQKIDVVVVNMLNLKNQAEQRIHHLLSAKFKPFDGVFGSSDEVLGAIESGVDFETTVLDIVQRSRTDEEIVREFDTLTLTLQDQIEADMQTARGADTASWKALPISLNVQSLALNV
ncbi:MAG: hypothetical protein IPK28_06875 [Devosia sp.]|nr:hypothetical protein [Devosia sp.]